MTVFTRIRNGEIPGRFVWKDEKCFSILTINPVQPGHVMVIPNDEIDDWLDVPDELHRHLFTVARTIARAQKEAFRPTKIGLSIIGLEVRHVHLHLIPISQLDHVDFARADKNPDPKALDAAAQRIRDALTKAGARGVAS
jgi:histidine triad (HIT) family protein